ncbi:MAG TPA: hypothetical protein VIS48_01650 [Candidatus Kryptonia bacterium]
MKQSIKIILSALAVSTLLTGCTNKINQSGSWLVTYDSTLAPRPFDSIKDSAKLVTSQINQGIADGAGSEIPIGKVPWTESDLLVRFFAGLDSVYYAETILSANIIFVRGPEYFQPSGYDVHNMQFEGFTMDTLWDPLTYTVDSINALGRGSTNIVLSQSIVDSTVSIQIDTSIARQWAVALFDTNVKNNGMIIKPVNMSGVMSLYSSAFGVTGYIPVMSVACVINGLLDTIITTSSNAMSAATTTITSMAPPGPYRIVQSGTGLRESVLFDLSSIPKFSIVNFAQLTVYADSLDTLYSGNSGDSLYVYYIGSLSPLTLNTVNSALSTQTGNKYVFNVTAPVQLMINRGNNGFMITRYSELSNLDSRFVYDENASDSLKPRLDITYAPVIKK